MPATGTDQKGEGASPFIPLCVPELGGREWEYVKECLDTNWVSSVGSYVDRFERMVAERAGAAFGVATVNGTAAIHIALLVSGVASNDEVIVPAMTFVAPVNAVRYCGAYPVILDVDPKHWQLDPDEVARFLQADCTARDGQIINRHTGRRVRAILPVHVLGHPCDMAPIVDLAEQYGLPVIEDATESLGATCRGRRVGSIGNIGCFSFNGNKIVTSGGGGVVVTDDGDAAAWAKHLTTQAKADPVEYTHDEIGFNYRLVNVLAALGCAQMEQLEGFIERKREIALTYRNELSKIRYLTFLEQAEWAASIEWLFTMHIGQGAPLTRQGVQKRLEGKGIQTRPLWCPMHRLPIFSDAYRRSTGVADRLYQGCLSLPSSVSLTGGEQERVLGSVANLLQD